MLNISQGPQESQAEPLGILTAFSSPLVIPKSSQ